MEGGSQSPNELVHLVIQRFEKLTRGSYGVDEALQQAKHADANSIERIILDEGELAWRAYYAAKKATRSDHGFSGKAKLTLLLNDLTIQPVEYQYAFAKQLSLATARDTIQSMENDGGNDSKKCPKRRTAVNTFTRTPSTPTATSNGPSTNYTDLEYSAPEQVSGSVVHQDGVHVDASLKASKTLFPNEFMDSIQRIPSRQLPHTLVADISMILQRGHVRDYFGCQMEIGISKEKVAAYAKKLFDVEVEVKDGVRYVRYPGGSKIEPDPSIKLRACRRDMISNVFGAEVDIGFSSAPIYQREEKEVRDQTDGVSMTISNQEREGAKITLFLGEWHAFNLKKKLYD
ncbi:hypothetical protein F4803DRAFT_309017 [Xylaria telfairii]|nr:hypothetical protein F4803DRAFT_309017 [Xylaria telfairii]